MQKKDTKIPIIQYNIRCSPIVYKDSSFLFSVSTIRLLLTVGIKSFFANIIFCDFSFVPKNKNNDKNVFQDVDLFFCSNAQYVCLEIPIAEATSACEAPIAARKTGNVSTNVSAISFFSSLEIIIILSI